MCVTGLNLMSQFNLENVTVYYTKPEELDASALKSVSFSQCWLILCFTLFVSVLWPWHLDIRWPVLSRKYFLYLWTMCNTDFVEESNRNLSLVCKLNTKTFSLACKLSVMFKCAHACVWFVLNDARWHMSICVHCTYSCICVQLCICSVGE